MFIVCCMFYHKRIADFAKWLSVSIEMIMCVWLSIPLLRCLALIGCRILGLPLILEMNPTWQWCTILFMCCWIYYRLWKIQVLCTFPALWQKPERCKNRAEVSPFHTHQCANRFVRWTAKNTQLPSGSQGGAHCPESSPPHGSRPQTHTS